MNRIFFIFFISYLCRAYPLQKGTTSLFSNLRQIISEQTLYQQASRDSYTFYLRTPSPLKTRFDQISEHLETLTDDVAKIDKHGNSHGFNYPEFKEVFTLFQTNINETFTAQWLSLSSLKSGATSLSLATPRSSRSLQDLMGTWRVLQMDVFLRQATLIPVHLLPAFQTMRDMSLECLALSIKAIETVDNEFPEMSDDAYEFLSNNYFIMIRKFDYIGKIPVENLEIGSKGLTGLSIIEKLERIYRSYRNFYNLFDKEIRESVVGFEMGKVELKTANVKMTAFIRTWNVIETNLKSMLHYPDRS